MSSWSGPISHGILYNAAVTATKLSSTFYTHKRHPIIAQAGIYCEENWPCNKGITRCNLLNKAITTSLSRLTSQNSSQSLFELDIVSFCHHPMLNEMKAKLYLCCHGMWKIYSNIIASNIITVKRILYIEFELRRKSDSRREAMISAMAKKIILCYGTFLIYKDPMLTVQAHHDIW